VNELLLAYLRFAESYYRDRDGQPSEKELGHLRAALRPLRELYGLTPAADFGPLKLKTVRERFVAAGRTRTHVNKTVQRIRRVFAWAVENELCPASVCHALQAVKHLERGRSDAREGEPVRPVPDHFVDATLPHVAPEVAAMVELQRLTGMRSGEVTIMRTGDIDATGKVWCYTPSVHKTEHHGHERQIRLGPKAQEVLRPWLRMDLTEYLFSPARARERRFVELRSRRKTRVQPSQRNRRKARPRKLPGERWTTNSYYAAVQRGIATANRLRRERGEDEIPDWHPHQLRHSAATAMRKEYGLEVAKAVLGHRSLAVTQVYAEMDATRARDAAGKIG
jgi:integrase